MLKKTLIIFLTLGCFACNTAAKKGLTAQQIVDKAISASGGERYQNTIVRFRFRDFIYESEVIDGKKILRRIGATDFTEVIDVKSPDGFKRYVNDSLVVVADSMAIKYANSINSVHYFTRLPYGLNDAAVMKELLGEVQLKNQDYYKVKITFKEDNGGDDFEDIYIYWFDKQTYKPDYLAYQFYTEGGGQRFREAYNERHVNGIRFVDYKNYKTKDNTTKIVLIDSLFENGALELLSKIELTEIEVLPKG
ncbi:MAG: deoxyribose-phosphate aldolase [Croceitalea sp.]|nr:deoxyribose-phosphate aldolase [Croceitalea sp.]